MTTGGGDPIFVDTNVLVYAGVASAPRHQEALAVLRRLHAADTEIWLSRQVLREYLAVLSRPQTYTSPVPVGALIADIHGFTTRFRVAEDGPAVTDRLLALLQQVPSGGKQVHDANIVATMLVYGIQRLLTANPSDFARFGSLIVVEPLASRT
jgi:predicted nucleic acid-binding protein